MAMIELTVRSQDANTDLNIGLNKARAQSFIEGDADKIKSMSFLEKFIDFFRGQKQQKALDLLSDIMKGTQDSHQVEQTEAADFNNEQNILDASMMSNPLYAVDAESYCTDLGIISKFYQLKKMAKPEAQSQFKVSFNDDNELIFVIAGSRILQKPIKLILDKCTMGNSPLMSCLIRKANSYACNFDKSINIESSFSASGLSEKALQEIEEVRSFLEHCPEAAELKYFMEDLGIFRDDLILARLVSLYQAENVESSSRSPAKALHRMGGFKG
ncbi:hypothetical protein D5R81_12410 [Parashewanella spongiae]|uniref:Uncharacterized protein n=1 Tax=Parashewanella spongiae TaxID=342950 RepID=A0A3A6TVZ5_9GAMM|nr:hypothetical protein [Parashewanella spongiae]MCL1076661.1 hypothetical protein [Parashewanella spongiae]RJY12413.1 hypothetical protein D5R81_12410 [Parashewanella spongiae]